MSQLRIMTVLSVMRLAGGMYLLLKLWRQAIRWLALKEMGGFNPFYSPSLAWREAMDNAVVKMWEAMLESLPPEYERDQRRGGY